MTRKEQPFPVLSSAGERVCLQLPFYLFSPSTTCHMSRCEGDWRQVQQNVL